MWQRAGTLMNATRECEGSTDAHCFERQFSLDLLRLTRLHNPTLEMYLMLETNYLDAHEYYRASINSLNIHIVPRKQYSGELSRSAQYIRAHTDLGYHWQPDMMSRFCEVSDAVLALGLRRVLVMDSDVGLFTNINDQLKGYKEDVVTPCDWCSQIALYTSSALSNFCDAHIEFLLHEENAALRESTPAFNDMLMLSFFLKEHWQRETRTSYNILVEEIPSPRNPHPAVWIAASSVQFYDIRVPYVWHSASNSTPLLLNPFNFTAVVTTTESSHSRFLNVDCKKFDDLFDYAISPDGLPVLYMKGTLITLPAVHFQGNCKTRKVHELYVKYNSGSLQKQG